MAKFSDCKGQWFDLWCDDMNSIYLTMVYNYQADIKAGYNYYGLSITNQREQMQEHDRRYNEGLKFLCSLPEDAREKWCFQDLRRRGAIE